MSPLLLLLLHSLLLFLLFFSLSTPSPSATALGFGRKVGGRSVVPDVGSNQEVQELGRFSVEEYNRRSRGQSQLLLRLGDADGDGGGGSLLYFSRVVAAERQVVSGIKYYLKLKAGGGRPRGRSMRMFEAVVVVKPWLEEERKRRDLLSFRPLPNHGY